MPDGFDSRTWIRANCIGGGILSDEAYNAVSNFTVMWNLFEARGCEANVKPDKLKKLASRTAALQSLPDNLQEGFSFWQSRYFPAGQYSEHWPTLFYEKQPEDCEFVHRVLLGQEEPVANKVLALLLIIQRLRNNLFHGREAVPELNEQAKNLEIAAKTLGQLICVLEIPI